MPRVEKGSRVKGIPARVLLNIRDNNSGSYPIPARTSYDGRGAVRQQLLFNDGAVVPFTASLIRVGSGLPSGSRYYNNNPELQTTFPLVSGNVVSNVVDGWMPSQTLLTHPSFTPFKDAGEPSYDVRRDLLSSEFYATGSSLSSTGPGFQQPLWSKTKLSVNIPVNGTITMSMTKGSAPEEDFVMGYHNFLTGEFYNPGSGARRETFTQNEAGDLQFATTKAIGFFGSTCTYSNIFSGSLGAPGDACGFPFDGKYFVPASQRGVLYSLSSSLSEPFLAEKIVVEFSGSFEGLGLRVPTVGTAQKPAYVTFFVLNQKSPGKTDTKYGYKYGDTSTVEIASQHYSGSMDLVTHVQVATFNDGNYFLSSYDAARREFNVVNNGSYDWSGGFKVSGSVKSPKKYDTAAVLTGPYGEKTVGFVKGGRLGTGAACGRNYKSTIPANSAGVASSIGYPITRIETPTIENPYVLMPTDKLVFGWQTAVPETGYFDTSDTLYDWPSGNQDYCSRLSISGSVKVTIYGSHLRVGADGRIEEHHDTLNQLLSSNAIQEVIG